MTENEICPSECPCCGKLHTHATGVNHLARPCPGDITVCIDCGAINEFDVNLRLVLAPADHLKGPGLEIAFATQLAVRRMRRLPTERPRG